MLAHKNVVRFRFLIKDRYTMYLVFQDQKKLQSDLDQSKAKCVDLERAERMVRVDLEQASKRVRI